MIESIVYLPHPSPDMAAALDALKAAGYHLHRADNLEQALREIESGDVHLLLCLVQSEPTHHSEFGAKVRREFPSFPVLKMRGPLNTMSFLRRVRRLIYVGNLRRRLTEMEHFYGRLQQAFDKLDMTRPQDVLARACKFLADLTASERVMWVPAQRGYDKDVDSGKSILQRITLRSHTDGTILGHFVLKKPTRRLPGLKLVIRVIEMRLSYALAFESARQMSYLDDLTSLYNQRYLPLIANQEMSRARRDNSKLSLLFMDIDFFKSVNDSKGHLVGSQVLVQMADVLRSCTRTYDYIFRYGGDEFVVVLPNTTVEEGQGVAERIRQQVEITTFVVNGAKVYITVSIGIATFPDHATSAEQVLQMADEAMYNGKNASRNIVYIAS